jgi:hypothetical protein
MKFLAVAAALVGAAFASRGNVTYTTEVVTAYTTYCPAPTTLTYSDKTYTITEATTLTITDCPCTVSKPVMTSTVTACNTCGPHANGTATYVAPTGGKTTTTAAPAATTAVTAGAGKVGLSLAAIVAAIAAL